MGGLQSVAGYLAKGALPCSPGGLQIVLGIAVAAAAMLVGKLFCGYVCPIGTVEDLIMKFRQAICLKSIEIPSRGVPDKLLRSIKYVLLFWVFYAGISASAFVCRKIDPYYLVMNGFSGGSIAAAGIVAIVAVTLGGLVVDNFWCRYICPLGALCNTFRFWLWCVVLLGVFLGLGMIEVHIPWWALLGMFCIMGYILEVVLYRPNLQLLYIQKDGGKCNRCGECVRQCPYHIEITEFDRRIASVDCTLCGECVASCHYGALHPGVISRGFRNVMNTIFPALLTVAFAVAGFIFAPRIELPAIDEKWGLYADDSLHTCIVSEAVLESVKVENLDQLHCYGSCRSLEGILRHTEGVHGVSAYIRKHYAIIYYDPRKITAPTIRELVNGKFKCK